MCKKTNRKETVKDRERKRQEHRQRGRVIKNIFFGNLPLRVKSHFS